LPDKYFQLRHPLVKRIIDVGGKKLNAEWRVKEVILIECRVWRDEHYRVTNGFEYRVLLKLIGEFDEIITDEWIVKGDLYDQKEFVLVQIKKAWAKCYSNGSPQKHRRNKSPYLAGKLSVVPSPQVTMTELPLINYQASCVSPDNNFEITHTSNLGFNNRESRSKSPLLIQRIRKKIGHVYRQPIRNNSVFDIPSEPVKTEPKRSTSMIRGGDQTPTKPLKLEPIVIPTMFTEMSQYEIDLTSISRHVKKTHHQQEPVSTKNYMDDGKSSRQFLKYTVFPATYDSRVNENLH